MIWRYTVAIDASAELGQEASMTERLVWQQLIRGRVGSVGGCTTCKACSIYRATTVTRFLFLT